MLRPRKQQWDFHAVLAYIESRDKRMAALISSIGPLEWRVGGDYFDSLSRAIVGQQVSVKAAESIYQKFLAGMGGALVPSTVSQFTVEELRRFGLSPQKSGYIADLAHHFIHQPGRFLHLAELDDGEVIRALVEVKGIGKWTAQMFCMFTLGRQDVFAADDLGVRNAMIRVYGWKTLPDKEKLEHIAARWSPYRTIMCRYLWHSLNNESVHDGGKK
jgi:DNA-3-methyladenine glycosylase II